MTAARDNILEAIRSALGPRSADLASVAAEAMALLAERDRVRPKLKGESAAADFADRLTSGKVKASVDHVRTLQELPQAVAAYLRRESLQTSVALQPEPRILQLDWTGLGVHTAVSSDEVVTVGLARSGIAETGSLVFHSGAHAPVLFNFLPLHSIVAVEATTIVQYFEDYLKVAAEHSEPAPRNLIFITGASGTTDIEGTLVYGAHGPAFLHVIVIGDDTAKAGGVCSS